MQSKKLFNLHYQLHVKVAISEFGLLMLMLILLNHYMFIEGMGYLHEISGLEANKTHFESHCFVYNKAKWAFLITFCYIVLFLWRKSHNLAIG